MTEETSTSAPNGSDEPRPGEVALEIDPATLPADAGLVFIGHIETPWKERSQCPRNSLQTDETCTIVVDPAYRAGLEGLGAFSHIYVLYWMDKARRDLIRQSPRHASGTKGTFALRSPVRPNPVALSVCEVRSFDAESGRIEVHGPDCLDGTPVVDIKPYFAMTDARPEASKRS